MSIQDLHDKLAKQDHSCAICNCTLNTGRYTKMNVDHDHLTGLVRGLLCFQCNAALGLMKESPHRCDAMKAYILEHQTQSKDIV